MRYGSIAVYPINGPPGIRSTPELVGYSSPPPNIDGNRPLLNRIHRPLLSLSNEAPRNPLASFDGRSNQSSSQ
jgi:hypothetical protein